MNRFRPVIQCALGLTICSSAAWASPQAEVASAFDRGDSFDLHFSLDYEWEVARADITREDPSGSSTGYLKVIRDLRFSRSIHRIHPRLAVGVFTDLAITAGLPITISDNRSLSFARGVDASNSTTITDGLLPDEGFDALDPDGNFGPGSNMIFSRTEPPRHRPISRGRHLCSDESNTRP